MSTNFHGTFDLLSLMLQVMNGVEQPSTEIVRVCGTTKRTVESSSNEMTVIFRTDGRGSGHGFRATYDSNKASSELVSASLSILY